MTDVHVCRLCKSCQCLVCLTCLAGKMSSKTILIGLSIFRCGVEKSVHGRPSWELAPYDCSLQNTIKILRRGANLCPGNANSMIALESAEWLDIQRNFLCWISQTAWDAVRLDFIDNKEKVITKDYELHGRCDFLVLCTVILHFSQSPIVTIVVHTF